jgi:hypothetical protein
MLNLARYALSYFYINFIERSWREIPSSCPDSGSASWRERL